MKSLRHYHRKWKIWRNKQIKPSTFKKITPLMLAVLLSKEMYGQDKRLNDFLQNNEFLTLSESFRYSEQEHIDIDSDGDLDIFFTKNYYGVKYFLPSFIKNNGLNGLPNYEYDNYLKDSSNLFKVMGLENFNFYDSIIITSVFYDFDHDGDVDLLNKEEYYNNKKLKFYKNNLVGNKPIFDTVPSLVLDHYNFTDVIDVTGDGLEDLVRVHNSTLIFYPNIGNQNIPEFGNEVIIPLNYDFSNTLSDLKDMDGDKLIDIAKIKTKIDNFSIRKPTEISYYKCLSQNPLLFESEETAFFTKEQSAFLDSYREFSFVYLLDFDLDGDIDFKYFPAYRVSYEQRKTELFFMENLNTKSLNEISGTINMDWDKNGDVDDYEYIYEYIESLSCGYGCYYSRLSFNLNPTNYLNNKNLNFETPDTIIKIPIKNSLYTFYQKNHALLNPFFFKGFANSGNLKIYPDSLEGFNIVPPYYEFNLKADSNHIIDSIIFNYQPKIDEKNLSIDLSGFANRPGFETFQKLVYQNKSALLDSGIISYTPDSLYTFIDATPPPSSTLSGTYFWNIDSIAKFETRYIDIKLLLSVDAEIGKTTKSTALFNSNFGPDRVPQNNYDTLIQRITGSYDPNDKIVTPIPNAQNVVALTEQPFEYTIRFQNTGNDTAFTVVITDTLDKDFDISTFNLLAASGPFIFDMKSGKVATWRFNNILLPPKSTNEQGSHGFVKYSIKPKSSAGLGTEFTNKANIYFDFNKPIVTNETRNIFGVINGIQLHDNQPEINIKSYPNPVHDRLLVEINNPNKEDMIFKVYDLKGTELFSKTINSNFFHFGTIDLSPAMYLYTIDSANGFGKGKFVKE
ncbi:MAG: T9SS type A sorting domain-containing protein [Bacteroidetes bacterium]|nr:T9SS type A sorting domain-containing protein [Bacteroidota bacterium]